MVLFCVAVFPKNPVVVPVVVFVDGVVAVVLPNKFVVVLACVVVLPKNPVVVPVVLVVAADVALPKEVPSGCVVEFADCPSPPNAGAAAVDVFVDPEALNPLGLPKLNITN